MSRVFQQKNKDLVNLDVVSADNVWIKKQSEKWEIDNVQRLQLLRKS